MNKIQSIVSVNPQEYMTSHHLSFQQIKVMNNIISCQTPNMGSHRLVCECGNEKIVNNSCHNRHCPICGNFKKEMWIQKQQETTIHSHYFHLVFTIPSELRSLTYFNQEILYNLLYDATSKTILDLSHNQLSTIPGFSLILHTWSQTLTYHPHLHCILAGGGLSFDQTRFKSFKKKFFLPVKMISKVFKAKYLEGLKLVYEDKKLKVPNELTYLTQQEAFKNFVNELYTKDWVVYCKKAFKSAIHVINYLGRYTHKIAIYDNRIKYFDEYTVTFEYHDRSDHNKRKELTLQREEFMRRFLDHVLPYRFTKIRHYGFLSNRLRHQKTEMIRKLIELQRGIVIPIVKALDKESLLTKLIGDKKACCPICGGNFHYYYEYG